MKATRANVERYCLDKDYKPIQIDSIPEVFSWIEPDIEIGGVIHKGRVVKFKPLAEFNESISYEERNK